MDKLERLKSNLVSLGRVAVAFSGGVDATFLVKVTHDTLGDDVLAVTVRSNFFPDREFQETKSFCEKEGIRQIVMDVDGQSIEGFRENPVDRCYHCKKYIFTRVLEIAKSHGFEKVAEGSNTDDDSDYRPGHRAITELGILSPLKDAGLSKKEIRAYSMELGLSTWKKPSMACLATRFVYGEEITPEKLQMVDKAEQLLMDLGFSQFRVRVHGSLARIEIMPEEFNKFFSEDSFARSDCEHETNYHSGLIRQKVHDELRKLGFSYVTLDLGGYRTGSMNEVILQPQV